MGEINLEDIEEVCKILDPFLGRPRCRALYREFKTTLSIDFSVVRCRGMAIKKRDGFDVCEVCACTNNNRLILRYTREEEFV